MASSRSEFSPQALSDAPVQSVAALSLPVEEQHSLLFDRSPLPTWLVDPDTLAYLAVNEAAIKHYGYSRDEFLTMTAKDIRPREDVRKFVRYIRALPEGHGHPQVWRHLKKNGEQVLVEMFWHETEFRGRTALLVFGKDVTEQQRLEQSLYRHQQEFRALVENSPDIIARIDSQLRFLYVNGSLEPLTGVAPEALLGKSADEVPSLPAELAECWRDKARETLRRGRENQCDISSVIAGSQRHFSVRMFPEYDRRGRVTTVFSVTYDVTDEKNAEIQLRESREQLADVIDNASVGLYWVDAGGHIVWANKAQLDLLGYAEDEYIGHHVSEFHADPEVAAHFLASLNARQPLSHYEARLRARDGGVRYVTISSNISWRDGKFQHARCFTHDITARKEAERRLKESESRYRSIFDTVPVALLELDVDGTRALMEDFKARGAVDFRRFLLADPQATHRLLERVRITEANEAALRLFSASSKEQLLESLTQLCNPRSDEAFSAGLIALWEGDAHYAGETVVSGLRGRQVNTLFAMSRPGESLWGHRVLVTLVDVTERKQADAERTELLAREHAARRQAEMASRAKDEFLATLSHELRTPLNAILGWAQTLQHDEASPDLVQRGLAAIERSARIQSELINDLLYVADIVAGRVRLNMADIRLTRSIEGAVESLQPAMTAKRITFRAHIDPDADVLYGDEKRLQQVVWNLLSNAVKFTPPGGQIRVRTQRVDGHVELTVADTGEGIKPRFLPYVFERFRQADGTSRKRYGGLGIGLAIVRHLVELHGGTVSAQSEGEGRGATFVVRLPSRSTAGLEAEPGQPHPGQGKETDARNAGAEPPPAGRGKPLEGVRVLFVDDDAFTREMLEEAFSSGGATTIAAASATEALEKVQACMPDVIVSDIGMPEEDGYDLMQKVRELPAARGGATPAVALTGYARERDRRAVFSAGYQAFTSKPVDLNELFKVVRDVLDRADPRLE